MRQNNYGKGWLLRYRFVSLQIKFAATTEYSFRYTLDNKVGNAIHPTNCFLVDKSRRNKQRYPMSGW